MAEEVRQEAGQMDVIGLRVRWCADKDVPDARALAWGEGTLLVAGEPVWPPAGEGGTFRWTWLDLLEFLSASWTWLLHEQSTPLKGLKPAGPDELWDEAARQWPEMPQESILAEKQALFEYRARHNLAAAIKGADVPGVWLIREGSIVALYLEEGAYHAFPFDDVKRSLEAVGQLIADRVAGADHPRARKALEAWERKEAPLQTPQRVLELVTGLEAERLGELQSGTDPVSFWGDAGTLLEDRSELAAAARMTGEALGNADLREVLHAIVACPYRPTQELDGISREAREVFDRENIADEKPFEQGYWLAHWLRERLDLSREMKVDPEGILSVWGIWVGEVALESDGLDAVACWGPRHGPAVIVNKSAARAGSTPGRRASLAHEICHLLLDRGRGLSVAEALGGAAPAHLEQRAKAFAAELLLPQGTAAERVRSWTRPLDASFFETVSGEFGVSHMLLAWQIRNQRELFSTLSSDEQNYVEQRTRFREQVSGVLQ